MYQKYYRWAVRTTENSKLKVLLSYDNYMMPAFLFTTVCGWYSGISVVLPWFYSTHPEWVLILQKCFGTVSFAEMMLNWLCVKCVDSTNKDRSNLEYDPEDNRINSELNSIYITEKTHLDDDKKKRRNYPYWSWSYCSKCKNPRPRRCYHCPICDKCILKVDHHCFLTRCCVGFYNQRHFTVFCFWSLISCLFSLYHCIPYFLQVMIYQINFFDLFFPFAFLRAIIGDGSFQNATFIALGTSIGFFTIESGYRFLDQILLIDRGVTTYEDILEGRNQLEVIDKRTFNGKIRSVCGRFWALNFFIPVHCILLPEDDPINWPNTEVQ